MKECLRFCGPSDPTYGNTQNAREREAAKECLGTIYADNSAVDAVGGAPTMHNAGLAGRVGATYGHPPHGQGRVYRGQGGSGASRAPLPGGRP